jgi:hypothetical protein
MLGHRDFSPNNRYTPARYDFDQVDEEDMILQRFVACCDYYYNKSIFILECLPKV